MLSKIRIVLEGRSEHAHEQEALAFIRGALPDHDPIHLWELAELVHPSQPRLLEIDALVLGYSALYLVEIKGGPGRYTGDSVDWTRTHEGRRHDMDAPLRSANAKARVLKSLLEHRLKNVHAPFVQALVFLSHEQAVNDLDDFGRRCVVKRSDFARAITHHEFLGADASFIRRPLDVRTVKEVVRALKELGFRPGKRTLKVGGYELREVLEDGEGYQDRHAVHPDPPGFQRRARIYLVPQQTSVERRQHLIRGSSRDAQLLESVKDHKGVLRLADYVQDAPLGPTLLFDHFPGVPLDAFLRRKHDLTLDQRIELILSIGAALSHCHRKQVVHGAVCPGAVLVAEDTSHKLETRLYNFQLGRSDQVQATQHWSAHADDASTVYRAPELRCAPDLLSPATDTFSFAALTYFVLTGVPPGRDVADVDALLERDGALDPRIRRDDISEGITQVIIDATRRVPATRELDSIDDFLLLLEDAATAPDKQRGEVSPLEAKKGDYLGEGLQVQSVLGHGASSRVLRVLRESDGKEFALKAALTETDDDRLAEEARLLDLLRHSNIVQFYKPVLRLADRTCLLMAIAGDQTLQQSLLREGVISLDYAARYGEELLSALQTLEEAKILHRDIKPGNIGVGAARKAALHLTLFDFSLAIEIPNPAAVSPNVTHLKIGTAAYRDPYLHLRGAWDHAADRWSAAITLHEMLTGVRPSVPDGLQGALDPSVHVELAAERFDTSVRDRLYRFFERALHPHVESRFESAEAMRKAFNLCFEQGVITAHEAKPSDAAPSVLAVGPDTPIASLPLPARAISALDRAGLLHAGELMSLPENRLSAVRGVGRQVIRDVLAFRETYREALAQAAAQAAFDPAFQGYGRPLGGSDLDPAVVRQLVDAGLGTTDRLAQAPRSQLDHLAQRGGFSLEPLEALLKAETRAACDRQHPTTVNAWIDALLPKSGKVRKHLRLLWGLDAPLRGRIDVESIELAKHLNCTAANIYLSLANAELVWREHPELPKLVTAARAVVREAGGPLPVKRAAEALFRFIPPVPSDDRSLDLVRSAALLRVVCRVDDPNDAECLSWERLPNGPWLCTSTVPALQLKELGQAADQLAARVPLPSASEVERQLREIVAKSAIADLATERLTELAAESSANAARSPRLELYPRNLSAQRALELSAATLAASSIDAEELQRRVHARYPEAFRTDRGFLSFGLCLRANVGRSLSGQPRSRRGFRRARVPTRLSPSSALD